jgi:ribosomal protein L7Ae-like RNA K-turn-binding protein
MEEYSIKCLRKQVTKEMRKEQAKLEAVSPESPTSSHALPTLKRKELVPYKHMPNLAKLALGSTQTVMAIGQLEHYGQKRLV